MREVSLLKIFDEIILPFVIFIAARYIGFFLFTFIQPIEYTFGSNFDSFTLPFIQFTNIADLVSANSFSWVFTAAVLAISFGFTAFRSLHLDEDWLHPKEAKNFHSRKMDHLIISSHEALHQSVSWSAVAAVVVSTSTADFLVGNLLTVTYGIAASISAVLIILFLLASLRRPK